MLSSGVIKSLNSKNVSHNPVITKERLVELWEKASKQQKEKAVNLGAYTDVRSFNKTRSSGYISVRMVLALAITLNIDPFYITAHSDEKETCTEENINRFLEMSGYGNIIETCSESPTKKEVLDFVSSRMDDLTTQVRQAIASITNEELVTLLQAYLIRAKAGNEDDLRLFLIRLLLAK